MSTFDAIAAVSDATLESLVERLALAREAEVLLERLLAKGSVKHFDAAGPYRSIALGIGSQLQPGDLLSGTQREWPAALATELPLGAVFASVAGSGRLSELAYGLSLSPVGSGRYVAEAVGYALGLPEQSQNLAVAVLGPVTFDLPEVLAALRLAASRQARVVFVVRGPLGDALPWTGQVLKADGASAASVGLALQAARGLLSQGPVLIDGRSEADGAPLDVLALQARGLLSPDKERELAAQIKVKLDAARLAAHI